MLLNFASAAPGPVAPVDLVRLFAVGVEPLAVGQELNERRLERHQRPDLFGMAAGELDPDERPAAESEHIRRLVGEL
jgi:hypothetical protein